jgi:hypothetical protein
MRPDDLQITTVSRTLHSKIIIDTIVAEGGVLEAPSERRCGNRRAQSGCIRVSDALSFGHVPGNPRNVIMAILFLILGAVELGEEFDSFG